jgi:hypothetical protein
MIVIIKNRSLKGIFIKISLLEAGIFKKLSIYEIKTFSIGVPERMQELQNTALS